MKKIYDAQKTEIKIQEFWDKEKIFKFNPKSKKKIYSIDTPPPTISGMVHVGHVFSYSQWEFMARFWRMNGKNMFVPFGFDNNGLPTELLTEKEKGVRSKNMKREDFIKLVFEVEKKYKQKYKQIWKRMGISCDWGLTYDTISERVRKISQLSFLKLYEMGIAYRAEAPAIWCPKCETPVSQVELEDKEFSTFFSDIIFKDGKNDIVISTTRPELLPACVAVFVHPDDKRHKGIIGKKAKVPLFDFSVEIIADKRVDMTKGTGIVMCCTFGDLTDIDWFKAYKLPYKKAIDEKGRMTKIAGKYAGMRIEDARKEILNDLEKEKLLVKKIPHKHFVNTHDRCGAPVEFIICKQWFIKYLDMKQELINVGRKIKWHPEYMRTRYENWIKGLQWDWCISLQRYYGIPFPVWYCKKCGKEIIADKKDLPVDPLQDKPKKCRCCSTEFVPETDVMNTWATSALTPLINAHWGEKNNLMKKIYPFDLRPNAHDIITFWDFNTIVKGLFHTGRAPFKTIMVSGHGLDPKGKKMSKSKGNVVEPMEVIEKYSADALRYWAASAKLGENMPFQEKDVANGQKLLTKLWNASLFVSMNLKAKPKKVKLKTIDKWIISKMNELIKECTDGFKECEYAQAKTKTEIFFWKDFCDNYLEIVKHRLYAGDESARWTIYNALLNILKLFSPIIPHVTEEIYQQIYRKHEKEKSIHVSKWPVCGEIDKKSLEIWKNVKDIVSEVRKWKSSQGMALNAEISKIVLDKKSIGTLGADIISDLKGALKAKEIKFGKKFEIVR